MKRIQVVIFDCDGVMFDSRQANVNYYNHMLQHFSLSPMPEDEVDFVHMHTADDSIRHIFRGSPFLEQARAYRMEVDYTPFIKDMVIEPGLKEVLRQLKSQYGLAVATNRSDTIGNVLELNGLTKYFDIVVSSLDVQFPKPHPESIYKILNYFQISPEQAIYVGDSSVDWQTAQSAGVTLVAYQNTALETPWRITKLLEIGDLIGRLEEERKRPESLMKKN